MFGLMGFRSLSAKSRCRSRGFRLRSRVLGFQGFRVSGLESFWAFRFPFRLWPEHKYARTSAQDLARMAPPGSAPPWFQTSQHYVPHANPMIRIQALYKPYKHCKPDKPYLPTWAPTAGPLTASTAQMTQTLNAKP